MEYYTALKRKEILTHATWDMKWSKSVAKEQKSSDSTYMKSLE